MCLLMVAILSSPPEGNRLAEAAGGLALGFRGHVHQWAGRREHVHTKISHRLLQSSKGQDASQQSLRHGVPDDLAARFGGRQRAVWLSFPLGHLSLPDQVSLHLEGSKGSDSMKFLTISVSFVTWTESPQGCSTFGHLATPPRGSFSGLFRMVTLSFSKFFLDAHGINL